MVPDYLVELAHERAHVLRVDRSVLHEGQRLGVAVHAHQQAEPVLPHAPDVGLGGPVQQVHAGIPQAPPFHVGLQPFRFGGEFRLRFAIKLHGEDGAGVALDEGHRRRQAHRLAGAVEHVFVHDLDGRRPVVQDLLHRLAGLENVGEVDDGKGGHRGAGHQVDLDLGSHAQRALRAHYHFG